MKTTTSPPRPLNPVLGESEAEDLRTDSERHEEQAPTRPQAARPSNGRYRLLTNHVIDGGIVLGGTEVGNDCDIAWNMEPTNQMEGVDDAGKENVNKLHQRLYGRDAPWHDENSSHAQARRDAEGAERQREEEKGHEPVSHQQAFERGHEEYRGQPVAHPRVPRPAAPKGGDTSQPLGPATADQNKDNPDVQVRTTRPLEDQRPK